MLQPRLRRPLALAVVLCLSATLGLAGVATVVAAAGPGSVHRGGLVERDTSPVELLPVLLLRLSLLLLAAARRALLTLLS